MAIQGFLRWQQVFVTTGLFAVFRVQLWGVGGGGPMSCDASSLSHRTNQCYGVDRALILAA